MVVHSTVNLRRLDLNEFLVDDFGFAEFKRNLDLIYNVIGLRNIVQGIQYS